MQLHLAARQLVNAKPSLSVPQQQLDPCCDLNPCAQIENDSVVE
jgi:hypothetical protein